MNVLISEEDSINSNRNNNNNSINNSINLNSNINKPSELNLIFRNQLSEDTHLSIDLKVSTSIFDIKKILYEKLNITETSNKTIKLFFKGRPLRDDEQIKFLKLSQNDVILYMIISNKPSFSNNENNININNRNNNNDGILSINEEEINRSINEINRRNNLLLLQRGFNIFLNYGVSEEELHVIRLLFHYTLFQQYRNRGLNMDWSNEAMLEREERWLRNYNFNNSNNIRNRLYENRRNNNNIILIRRRRNYFGRNGNDVYFTDNYYEPNYCFLQGFVIGFLLNIFTLLCLILCKFRRKFRLGLQMGMLISICIFILPLSNH